MKTTRNELTVKPTALPAVGVALVALSANAVAWDAPVNISEDDDDICWQSAAPSTNIYEDGVYLATVHDENCYGPIFDNSVYHLVAHDNGLNNDFSVFSEPYLVLDDESDEADDDDELEFEESLLYFELNNTDGDLGIHGKVDGDEWRQISLEDPNGRSLIDITNQGSMAIQGLTELFFESAEPTFDELNPDDFFARFPEGTYEWAGITTEGDEIEGEAYLSHKIPAAPVVFVNDTALDTCATFPAINASVDGSYTVSWNDVFTRHPVLGQNPGAMDVDVDIYQFVLERDEQTIGGEEITALNLTIDLDADVTEFTLPRGLIGVGQVIKNEVLVRSEEGNQSATELCWTSN